ncbi:hypothetical protein M409DRAFT_68917 [Zasmidium cellare ATCC 36951]|uniref:Peroxisomal biogenesis factor 11 n=1 Tax=Zasmidium cellare ATCC 36951 TaxID=1080233 RepID=A0A6A6C8L6_ZASCE|nr:uncharacterized protein M409DRAFT_68917 [Zasmidium cellare ATCC 36951]KAF2162598.1 hypothetical protein M409DRAFT_68917 [Zasmidium cellare ATCC 36951]
MLQSIVTFTDTTPGLEKSLRLFQSLCTILVGLSTTPEDLALWVKLRAQFALGRRYFRLLKWHPCWSNALAAFHSTQQQSTPSRTAVEVTKWSFLGLYFFLEMFTISNALRVTTFEWGPKVQMEANRCWFFALVSSILVSIYDFMLHKAPVSEKAADDADKDEKTNGHVKVKDSKAAGAKEKSSKPSSPGLAKVYQQLVIDSCDIFIPGAAVNWIPVGPLVVGIASTISTTVAGYQIWIRVQQQQKAKEG